MKELGFDGGSLDALIGGATTEAGLGDAAPAPRAGRKPRAAAPEPVEDDDEA